MILSATQQRFTKLVGGLIDYAYSKGYALTLGDANCATGHMTNSLHYQRLAVDLNLFVGGCYMDGACSAFDDLGAWWKAQDPLCRWGGDIKTKQDYNHFSMATGPTDARI